MINLKTKRKDLFFIAIVMLAYFTQKLLSYKLGIYMEECRDANIHLLVLNGGMPYKDFQTWVYGPFSFCIYPVLFKLFGVNLIVFRLSYIVISSCVIPIVYYLSKRLMPPLWSALAAFLSIVLIDVPYYTYNHIFATIAGLLAILFIFRFIKDHDLINSLFFAGIFIGVSLLVKPFFMGIGIFLSIFLFMLYLKYKKADMLFNIKLNHFIILILGIFLSLTPFLAYFFINKSFSEFFWGITPIGSNRMSSFYCYPDQPFPSLILYLKTLIDILPYKIIFYPSHWKSILVSSYDKLILFSPLIFPAVIILFNKFVFYKYNLISDKGKIYFILFTLFSLFISIQSLIFLWPLGRSFTMQVPFILIVYFLFLINNRKLYKKAKPLRWIAIILSIGFIFYLTSLHFIRYPYSRYKKYIVPLELERAKGIKVTSAEKEVYQSLYVFLSKNTKKDEVIGILGYYPHLPFLFERDNVFNDETFSLKLNYLSEKAKNSPIGQEKLKKLEDSLINRLKLEKPKFILEPIIFTKQYPRTRINKYIDEAYILEKTIGPAEIDIYTLGIINIYRLRQ